MPVSDLLMLATGLILLAVLAGLYRALRGPAAADRMMAAQLLSTGGIACPLLAGEVDVALVLALLGAFASVAFVLAARGLDER